MPVGAVLNDLRLLRRGLRHLEVQQWLIAFYGLCLLVGSGFMVPHSFAVGWVQYLGTPGTVHVQDCEWDYDRGEDWICVGLFVSDDGEVQSAVTVDRIREPQERIPALIAGPSSTTAQVPDRGQSWVVLAGVVFLAMTVWAWRAFLKQARKAAIEAEKEPAEGLSWPPEWTAAGLTAPEPQETAPPLQESTRGLPRVVTPAYDRLWLVLAGYLLFLVITGGFLWEIAWWNQRQDNLLSSRATAEVVAVGLGSSGVIEVEWTDRARQHWTTRLTPHDPDQFQVGDVLELRYHPDRPDDPYPVDSGSFDSRMRDRNGWAILLLMVGLPWWWAWTWRMGRWALGMAATPRPARVEVLVADLKWGTEETALWLRIRDRHGRTWYQRVLWSRRLVGELATRRDGAVLAARTRACPGFRRMFVIEVAGVTWLLPASTARAKPPRNYLLKPFSRWRLGESHRDNAAEVLQFVLGISVLAALIAMLAGPAAVPYLLAIGMSYWCWAGAMPWKGLFSYGAERRDQVGSM